MEPKYDLIKKTPQLYNILISKKYIKYNYKNCYLTWLIDTNNHHFAATNCQST